MEEMNRKRERGSKEVEKVQLASYIESYMLVIRIQYDKIKFNESQIRNSPILVEKKRKDLFIFSHLFFNKIIFMMERHLRTRISTSGNVSGHQGNTQLCTNLACFVEVLCGYLIDRCGVV